MTGKQFILTVILGESTATPNYDGIDLFRSGPENGTIGPAGSVSRLRSAAVVLHERQTSGVLYRNAAQVDAG